ncbi:MAG: hypothetical protein IPM60_14675 [Rhodospirillales bacterium]|nr:hypothetical protein [Rhodospirillales bacterium]
MSARERNKGAAFEREVCRLLSEHFGEPVCRCLDQSRDGGADIHVRGWSIEAKRRARVAGLYDWLAQAGDGAADFETPVVVLRADRKPALVVMALDDWLDAMGGTHR